MVANKERTTKPSSSATSGYWWRIEQILIRFLRYKDSALLSCKMNIKVLQIKVHPECDQPQLLRETILVHDYKTLPLAWYLWLIFAVHRGLAWSVLHNDSLLGNKIWTLETSQYLLVGLLSDLWVSILFSLFGFLVAVSGNLIFIKIFFGRINITRLHPGSPGYWRWTETTILLAVGIATACHQSYAQFFRFQLVPFHLSYLADLNFLEANATSLAGWESLVLLGFTLVACGLLNIEFIKPTKNPWLTYGSLSFLVAIGLIAHNRNIHYRVQWFVPSSLQMNYLEKLYALYHQKTTPDALTEAEWSLLKTALKKSALGDIHEPQNLINLLSPEAPRPEDLEPIYFRLKENITLQRQSGKKPLILVFILESLRPSETGYFKPDSPSLTPSIDALASKGIIFKNAYATGSVTRGGQESTLCGLPSQRDFSMMRGGILLDYPYCLYKLVAETAETFWYHGGEARFDNQYSFWKSQGAKDLMSSLDFPENSPRTSWGIGDITFLKKVVENLALKHAATSKEILLGSILTVTNHIPWDIPNDIDPNILMKLPAELTHPSYRTTAYTDEAIRQFTDGLKQRNLWDQSLIIFVSDHGAPLPPLNQIYNDAQSRDLQLYSHINLFLSGGISEHAISHSDQKPLTIDRFVSQASIAPFVASLLEISPQPAMMADHLFLKHQTHPILSVVENTLFDPRSRQSWPVSTAMQRPQEMSSLAEDFRLLYFRALLQTFSSVSLKKSN